MSDATERAREKFSRISQPCVPDCGAPAIYLALLAALDYIEAVEPPWGTSDYKEILALYAEAKRKFEEAVNAMD